MVTNTGTAPALTLNSLTFNTNGTTATTNLNGARIYYTSTSSTFATTTQYGSDVTTFPGGSNPIVVNGSQTLVPGTNYFWIVYDVAISAPTGNLLDAECTSINIGSANTPSVTAPSGNRPIVSLSSPSCAYTYASFSSFPSIVGLSGTVVAGSGTALDDNQYTNITMPGSMTFEYNGKVYSSFGINANGFIWFGSYNPVTGNVYNPISTTLPYEGLFLLWAAICKPTLPLLLHHK
ncbi:MAG: hypothetical protein M0D57_10770 [Sphingobacteriales bacterium JAD_PAG50586_3]|nr:MAG: hypothetical protein M0D57_10770 [Sphingobacteriales bacterium JAD_PAG50586_3]